MEDGMGQEWIGVPAGRTRSHRAGHREEAANQRAESVDGERQIHFRSEESSRDKAASGLPTELVSCIPLLPPPLTPNSLALALSFTFPALLLQLPMLLLYDPEQILTEEKHIMAVTDARNRQVRGTT